MAQIQRNQPLYEQLMWRIKAQVAAGVLVIGENEVNDKTVSLKNMANGFNSNVALDDLVAHF